MKKNILFILMYLLANEFVNAQVLFTENFNSYPTGHLNTDYTGTTAGQGGWVTKRSSNVSATAMVTPETGKGNVVTFTTLGTHTNEHVGVLQKAGVVSNLWKNRNAGNNVLKYEYEIYGSGFFTAQGRILSNNIYFMTLRFVSSTLYSIEAFHLASNSPLTVLKNYTASTFPYNLWHKVEIFIDYNSNMAYYYIPTLNILKTDAINSSNLYLPDNIGFSGDYLKSNSIVKYDNIKLSALQSIPAYILSSNELVSAKFSMYPNPAINVININNNENILTEQVSVYNETGKLIYTKTYDNATEIQLNVENLASGTYVLHLQTDQGLAIKKLIKK